MTIYLFSDEVDRPDQSDGVSGEDLATLAERGESPWEGAGSGDVFLSAYAPRAARALCHFAGSDLDEHVQIYALDAPETQEWMTQEGIEFVSREAGSPASESSSEFPTKHAWRVWYPVIDYDRCTGCRQCVSFCLFGVYEVVEGRVVVARPRKCKDNCPACARICPAGAIIFPKHPNAPINGEQGDTPESGSSLDPTAAMSEKDIWALRQRAEKQRPTKS
jgi:NAD-dependent dihydropyrimidine dehydrogenase PreA subunit